MPYKAVRRKKPITGGSKVRDLIEKKAAMLAVVERAIPLASLVTS